MVLQFASMSQNQFPEPAKEFPTERSAELWRTAIDRIAAIKSAAATKAGAEFRDFRTYAFRAFLSFPRRRESSVKPFGQALDSRFHVNDTDCVGPI